MSKTNELYMDTLSEANEMIEELSSVLQALVDYPHVHNTPPDEFILWEKARAVLEKVKP